MAITITAPKSSAMARAVRKILRFIFTRLPNNARSPSANAISVAIGIPHPSIYSGYFANTIA